MARLYSADPPKAAPGPIDVPEVWVTRHCAAAAHNSWHREAYQQVKRLLLRRHRESGTVPVNVGWVEEVNRLADTWTVRISSKGLDVSGLSPEDAEAAIKAALPVMTHGRNFLARKEMHTNCRHTNVYD